jgi:hypothetical protein
MIDLFIIGFFLIIPAAALAAEKHLDWWRSK